MTGRRFRWRVWSLDVGLLLAVAAAAALRLTRVGDWDNPYYTATVASMLRSPGNFFFGAFDPGGVVMVDKPPFAFWVQALFAAILGPSKWSVTLPQAIVGTLAIVVLYTVLKPTFGRVAAVAAAAVLAVVPAGVVVDSLNEPDSLLSFTLLLAALCVIRAVQTGRWRWLVAFALLMGIGVNIKMLVAFVPLPAFLLYYVLATREPVRRVVVRTAVAVVLLLLVSFSWATVVALTPAEHRPYVGSTRDNSIWTLMFKYNGLDRFTSFIGPRPRQVPAVPAPPGYQGPQPLRPPAITPDVPEAGLLGLFTNPLARQLGWLLPLGLLALAVVVVSFLPERVYRRPVALLALFRQSPFASQSLLWGGWFATAVVVFGLAIATTTHPYYLAALAVPMAAVAGIGLTLLVNGFKQGGAIAWLLAGALVGGAAYQLTCSRGQVADWAVAVVLTAFFLAIPVMTVAACRRLTALPLATIAVAAATLSLLLVPLMVAGTAGDRIVGPGAGLPAPASPAGIEMERQQVEVISSFVQQQGDGGSVFAVGTLNAREVAPFIIAGVPAVAIGGFSGSDPIFTPDSFRAMVEQGGLRYFLLPRSSPGGPLGRGPQEPILAYIRRTWEDVSLAAGLPLGTLYRYRGSSRAP